MTLPIDFSAATNISAKMPDDSELQIVHNYLKKEDPGGKRFARILRETIDQLLDGENTGRYDWNQLCKTEKTHAGTLVEINLQREFGFADGEDMDYQIEGIDVDCKFSQTLGGWMIPPEAMGEICLVVWANDQESKWSAGLARADSAKLTQSGTVTRKGNRDHKYRLNKSNLSMVTWLWEKSPLAENVLLHLDEQTRSKILIQGKRKGQARVNELFRSVHGKRISRGVVRTAAQQRDYMARVREGDSGRARPKLRKEGIIILGDYHSHRSVAAGLGGPIPEEGEFVAHRITRAKPHHTTSHRAELEGEYWVIAGPQDPVEVAPRLPEAQPGSGESG